MKMIFYNIFRFFLITCSVIIISCSSGEYDMDQYTVTYNEKSIKADTVKTIVGDDVTIDEKVDKYSYVVQIGAFVIQSNCEKFYAQAKQLIGPEVYFEFQNNLFKIRVGYFTNRADAILLLDKVLGLGYSDAFIVTKKLN